MITRLLCTFLYLFGSKINGSGAVFGSGDLFRGFSGYPPLPLGYDVVVLVVSCNVRYYLECLGFHAISPDAVIIDLVLFE